MGNSCSCNKNRGEGTCGKCGRRAVNKTKCHNCGTKLCADCNLAEYEYQRRGYALERTIERRQW